MNSDIYSILTSGCIGCTHLTSAMDEYHRTWCLKHHERYYNLPLICSQFKFNGASLITIKRGINNNFYLNVGINI